MHHITRNPAAWSADRASEAFCVAAERSEDTEAPSRFQGQKPLGIPSPEAVAAADEFVLDELYDAFDLIRSYAVSGIEAARRGDRAEVRLRLRVQLRDAFRYAVSVHNLLSQDQKGGPT
jgi:hypothetical protein